MSLNSGSYQAVEAGINFFDTANLYSNGSSEEILGRALNEFANRDAVVIATKVFAPTRHGPNALSLSRKAIMEEIDHSLWRLGTDYIDLYQIHRRHRCRWKVERLNAWLQNFRRILTRREYHAENYLGCIKILLRRYL